MSAVTVSVQDLSKLISAAKITASTKADDGPINGILLTSGNVPNPDGAGNQDILIASSTDGLHAGQVYIDADGQFASPVLLSLPATGWITSMVSSTAKQAGDKDSDNLVKLEVTGSGKNSLKLTVLVDGDPVGTAQNPTALLDADEFPTGDVNIMLTPSPTTTVKDADGNVLAKGSLQQFSSGAVGLLLKVAKVFDEVRIYSLGHPAAEAVVTAGERFRATVKPSAYPSDADVSHPDVAAIKLPDQPDRPEESADEPDADDDESDDSGDDGDS